MAAGRRGIVNSRPSLPLRGKILNTWEVGGRSGAPPPRRVHDISVAIGPGSGLRKISRPALHGKVHTSRMRTSDGLHIATLLCAPLLSISRTLVNKGHAHVATPPLYRIDIGKEVYYAPDEDEKNGALQRVEGREEEGQGDGDPIQGSG